MKKAAELQTEQTDDRQVVQPTIAEQVVAVQVAPERLNPVAQEQVVPLSIKWLAVLQTVQTVEEAQLVQPTSTPEQTRQLVPLT